MPRQPLQLGVDRAQRVGLRLALGHVAQRADDRGGGARLVAGQAEIRLDPNPMAFLVAHPVDDLERLVGAGFSVGGGERAQARVDRVRVVGMDERRRHPAQHVVRLVAEQNAISGRDVAAAQVEAEHGDRVARVVRQHAVARLARRQLGGARRHQLL